MPQNQEFLRWGGLVEGFFSKGPLFLGGFGNKKKQSTKAFSKK